MKYELKLSHLNGRDEDFNWSWYHSGKEFQSDSNATKYDAIIVISSNSDSGDEETLIWLRRHVHIETVIFMVANEKDYSKIINLLRLGADDFITKPFNMPVLLEKIRICLKRTTNKSHLNKLAVAGFQFDRNLQTVTFRHTTIECSSLELDLLFYLLTNLDKQLTRKQIFEAVWRRRGVESSRAVDNQIHRLRTKFCLTQENGFILQAIYGIGYQLSKVNPDSSPQKDLKITI